LQNQNSKRQGSALCTAFLFEEFFALIV